MDELHPPPVAGAVEPFNGQVDHGAGLADLAGKRRQPDPCGELVAVPLVVDPVRQGRHLRLEDVGGVGSPVRVGPAALSVGDQHFGLEAGQGGTAVVGQTLIAVAERLPQLGREHAIGERPVDRLVGRFLVGTAQRDRAGD